MAIGYAMPNTSIITIDLKSNDARLKDFYALPAHGLETIIKNRAKINSDCYPNISFLEMSSTMRSLPQQLFEIVWIDGDHTSFGPYNDLHYSLKVTDKNSLIMMDDVSPNDPNDATIAALRYLESDYELNCVFIQKRRHKEKLIAAIVKGSIDKVHPLKELAN